MKSLPETMRGVHLTGHGGYEVLDVRDDLSVPTPLENQVLIQVSAAGVNNTDVNTRTAWYSKSGDADDATWAGEPLVFPRVQGADVCGVIVAVGANVDAARIGDRVIIEPCMWEANGAPLSSFWYFGSECDGGFAEYTVVDSRYAHAVQSDLSDAELASFPCSYSTAENMLTRAQVSEGEVVLVTGASGGVGSAAIQLAKARGATVIAVTNAAKAPEILALGASKTILRDENVVEALGEGSVDVVIDLVGGPSWPNLLDVLTFRGHYATAGAVAGALVELDLRTLYLKDLSFYGCTALEEAVFPNLVKLIEEGRIKPLVAETFPLAEIVEAQKAFASKGYLGKIVLTVK